MDTIIKEILDRRNLFVTNLRYFEKSAFLLKCGLTLLGKQRPKKHFTRIIHVFDKAITSERARLESEKLPFSELGVKITKLDGSASDMTSESDEQRQLILCTLDQLFDGKDLSETSVVRNALVIFDGIFLESIESRLCEVHLEKMPKDAASRKFPLPKDEFAKFKNYCWSFLVACNPPTDGFAAELDCEFKRFPEFTIPDPISIRVITKGPNGVPFKFNNNEKDPRIHDEVGTTLEECVKQIESGGICVFFPSYGRMVEYHSAWQKSGLWDRLGVHYGRENRGGDHFKNGLIKMMNEEKSVFLCSIRYHQDERLAEFALAQARAVLVVGLPYPFASDVLDHRIKHNNEAQNSDNKPAGLVSGDQLCKYRAMELMNGVLQRCLNEYRCTSCQFLLLDSDLMGEPSERFLPSNLRRN